jgi:hypothetical protein
MATNTEQVQRLYIEYFQRPGDPEGVKFWVDALNTGNPGMLTQIEHDFATSKEYQSMYSGMSNRQMVETVYHNVFGRAADTEGLNFWTNALDTHSINIETMAREIVNGALTAKNADALTFNGRVAAATAFTSHIDTQVEIAAYLNPAAFKISSSFIGDIHDLTSAARANDPGYIDSVIAQIVGTPQGVDAPHFAA